MMVEAGVLAPASVMCDFLIGDGWVMGGGDGRGSGVRRSWWESKSKCVGEAGCGI